MTTFTLAGIKASPLAVADEKGNLCIFETTTNQVAETLARGAVINLGLANAITCYSMSVAQVAQHGIQGSMSYCIELGQHLSAVQRGEPDAFADLPVASPRRELFFSGKVVDIDRRTTAGLRPRHGHPRARQRTGPDDAHRDPERVSARIRRRPSGRHRAGPDQHAGPRDGHAHHHRDAGLRPAPGCDRACPAHPSGTSPGCWSWSDRGPSATTWSTSPWKRSPDEDAAPGHRCRRHQHRCGRGGRGRAPCSRRSRSPPPRSRWTASAPPSRASSVASTARPSRRRCWAPRTPRTPSSSAAASIAWASCGWPRHRSLSVPAGLGLAGRPARGGAGTDDHRARRLRVRRPRDRTARPRRDQAVRGARARAGLGDRHLVRLQPGQLRPRVPGRRDPGRGAGRGRGHLAQPPGRLAGPAGARGRDRAQRGAAVRVAGGGRWPGPGAHRTTASTWRRT